MFFKRLRTHGFKSFANKTEVQLKSGITIVVGPNGCGKSNVFDSIQWVLGEQRAKAMRGARMGDVIFAGSSAQKAANTAEVQIEISNEAGQLPFDATEIEITRRLHRSGESEYLINGRPARLKDIQRLMMGTGLGQNSYAVMQQGRMDEIINARPEQRRYLIEEAAGISKYKAQKEEAIRRLERTDEDLHRITDLMTEVKRNAGKLKKAAERAREYQQLSGRLRLYDMVIIARRFEELVEEQQEADMLFGGLEDRLGTLDSRIEELQTLSESSRDEMEELLALLEASQESQKELTGERERSQGEVKVLKERLAHIAERRERLRVELETLGGESTGHSADIAEAEAEITRLKTEIREDDLSLERRQAMLDGLREGATDHEQELANVRETIATLQADKSQLEAEVRFARQMLAQLDAKAGHGGENPLAALEAAAAEATGKMEAGRKAAFAIRDDYEQVAAKLTEKKEMLGKAEARQKELAGRHNEVMNALRDARSRLGALQQLQENYDGFVRGVKEVMKAADGGKLPGVIGVVANLVRPKEKCERAIEIAMGGAIQNIVVETAEDGKECINFLKRKDFGRATFLPLDLVHGRENDRGLNQIMKMPGVIGWATDLVEFDPHIGEAVFLLLGNTVVVEHLDVALLLEKKGFRTKYVTLDGDLLNPSGAMSGGSHRASGLLTREGEIASLAEASEELARQLVDIDADLDRLESSVAGYRRAITELSEESTKLQVSMVSAVKDAESLENAAKEIQRRHDEKREELETADDERLAHEDAVRLNSDYIKDLEKQVAELLKRAGELGQQQSKRGDTINEVTGAIQELKIGLAQKRERLAAAGRALERLQSDVERQSETLTRREDELEKLDADEKAAKDALESLAATLQALMDRHAAIEAEVKAQSADKQEKVDALQRLIEEQQEAQRSRNELVNELHEADVRRSQKATQIESLGLQAAEKFETDLHGVMASLEEELRAMADARAAEQDAKAAAQPDRDGKRIVDAEATAEVIALEFDHFDAAGDAHASEGTEAHHADGEGDGEQTAAERAKWLDHPLASLPMESLQGEAAELRAQIQALGNVNLDAIDEYARIEDRLGFMNGQQKDLIRGRDSIMKTIQKIDETTTTMFRECFDRVRENFVDNFRRLFGGGKADLVLTDPDNLLETGINIIAQPPGKKPQTITLLSGGERCLTAIGVMFALFQWKPSPFCVLDEIDAPLDDANVERFKAMIREFSEGTQFIIITHNKLTMELADTLFGVTMQDPGISAIVSVRFEELEATGLLEDAPPQAQAG